MKTGMNGTRAAKYWYRMMLSELAFVSGTRATDSNVKPIGTRNDQCLTRVGSARRSPRMSSGRMDDRAAPKMLGRPGALAAERPDVARPVRVAVADAAGAASSTSLPASSGSDSTIAARYRRRASARPVRFARANVASSFVQAEAAHDVHLGWCGRSYAFDRAVAAARSVRRPAGRSRRSSDLVVCSP